MLISWQDPGKEAFNIFSLIPGRAHPLPFFINWLTRPTWYYYYYRSLIFNYHDD